MRAQNILNSHTNAILHSIMINIENIDIMNAIKSWCQRSKQLQIIVINDTKQFIIKGLIISNNPVVKTIRTRELVNTHTIAMIFLPISQANFC